MVSSKSPRVVRCIYHQQNLPSFARLDGRGRPSLRDHFNSLFQKSSIMWNNCVLVPVPAMPCVLSGYTISRNCFPALISASVIWIVFWKCTLSSLVPCTSSNDPCRLLAALTIESLYPLALSFGRPNQRSV